MIVAVDSNVLIADPFLKGISWKILAHAARRLSVKLTFTEVVIIEAAAGYGRRIRDAQIAMDRWSDKHGSQLGLSDHSALLMEGMQRQEADYDRELRDIVRELPAEVLPIPSVETVELVRRATNRVPPCDSHGNGFRDTLNWMSIRHLLDSQEDDVLWVTHDSDFLDDDGGDLHPSLVAELPPHRRASITLAKNLSDAALLVASSLAQDNAADLHKAREHITNESLTEYFKADLLSNVSHLDLSARDLALPIQARHPTLQSLDFADSTHFDVKAPLDGGQSAVDANLSCAATIAFVIESGVHLPDEQYSRVSEGDGASLWSTVKTLTFGALIAVDQYHRPTGGEITSIKALPDDPGFRAWAAFDQQTPALRRTKEAAQVINSILAKNSGVLASTLHDLQPSPEVVEFLRRVADVKIPSGTLRAIHAVSEANVPPEARIAAAEFRRRPARRDRDASSSPPQDQSDD